MQPIFIMTKSTFSTAVQKNIPGSFSVRLIIEWGGAEDLGKSSDCLMIFRWP